MSIGLLGKSAISSVANTTVYITPTGINHAVVNILACNTSASNVSLRIAISDDSTVDANEYIDYDVVLLPGTSRERTAIVLSPGERIIMRADDVGIVARVHGFEK